MANYVDIIGTGFRQALGTIDAYNGYIEYSERMKQIYATSLGFENDGLKDMGIGININKEGKSFAQEDILKIARDQIGSNNWTEYVN